MADPSLQGPVHSFCAVSAAWLRQLLRMWTCVAASLLQGVAALARVAEQDKEGIVLQEALREPLDKLEDAEVEKEPAASPEHSRAVRLQRLAARLLSKEVQALLPSALEDEPARLSEQEVEQLFVDLVPGVRRFLFRQQHGVYALGFVKKAYADGWAAFRGSSLDRSLLNSIRLVVHHAHDGKPQAAAYLRQVAEAFMDCQAVQARVVERVALEIRGVRQDFRGQMVALACEYKLIAVRILAHEEMAKQGGPDGHRDPNHYENRLIMEVGDRAGLSQVDLRRARHDEHAMRRFRPFGSREKDAAAQRLLELFDVDALLKAFAAEVNSFSEASGADSAPRQFLEWASRHMSNGHAVLDEETCLRVEVGDELALAVFEALFMGGPRCAPGERYRGELVQRLFLSSA